MMANEMKNSNFLINFSIKEKQKALKNTGDK